MKEESPREQFNLKSEGEFLRPILGSMSWMENGGQFNHWSH
jgi:hypothetical protein